MCCLLAEHSCRYASLGIVYYETRLPYIARQIDPFSLNKKQAKVCKTRGKRRSAAVYGNYCIFHRFLSRFSTRKKRCFTQCIAHARVYAASNHIYFALPTSMPEHIALSVSSLELLRHGRVISVIVIFLADSSRIDVRHALGRHDTDALPITSRLNSSFAYSPSFCLRSPVYVRSLGVFMSPAVRTLVYLLPFRPCSFACRSYE